MKLLGSLSATLLVTALAGAHSSGPSVGGSVFAFHPTHVTGPDAGTNTCPVCKYGALPAVQVWVNGDSTSNVGKIAKNLETEISKDGLHKFRAFVVFIEPTSKSDSQVKSQLDAIASKNHLKNVALIYVRPNDESIKEYGIDSSGGVKNTIFAYVRGKVVKNFVNFAAEKSNLASLTAAENKAVSEYNG